MKVISQRQALYDGFGEVLRSSAIFYVRQSARTATTISLMNYWREKRGLDVALIASTRTLDGGLVKRERLSFDRGMVINYRPGSPGDFEGSVEIEVFSAKNLAIPYPAVMAIYATPRGVSMVHSYARAYSRHEVEEGRTISTGAEANWTLRDTELVRSFAVMHNGPAEAPDQMAALTVLNDRGERRTTEMPIPPLAPYASHIVRPAEHVAGLASFLAAGPGQATLRFSLREAFTRMLVGNEAADESDLQVTHSDFDFHVQTTDTLDPGVDGQLLVPGLGSLDRWLVLYPSQMQGRYEIDIDGRTQRFASDDFLKIRLPEQVRSARFRRVDGAMPTRINVGIGCSRADDVLPSEPSLGVMHRAIPPKRLGWGPCACGAGLDSRIVGHPYTELFGALPANERVQFRLYSANRPDYLESALSGNALARLDDGIRLEELFSGARGHLGGQCGYMTAYSDHGGWRFYTMLENANKSVSLEHCF